MKKLGLIGRPLKHSFSAKYFAEKFENAGIRDWQYDLYELEDINKFTQLLKDVPDLVGINVTIPYKQEVLKFIHELDEEAAQIGAINTISIGKDGHLKGYNTDVVGFEKSLLPFIGEAKKDMSALILGTGGASKAILFTLNKLGIKGTYVSRDPNKGIPYETLDGKVMKEHQLVVNCTPLGTFPIVDQAPAIPYSLLSEKHFLYDLVYNPEKSLFLQKGTANGAKTMNGVPMLALQAEASWEIWNKA